LDYLTEINPYYLALAIGMHAVSWILWGCRLKIMGNFIGTHEGNGEVKRLSLPKSLKIIFSSLFAACITPSQFGDLALVMEQRSFWVSEYWTLSS
jgi:uncharacterized protein (TIRG00374 family)